MISAPRSDSLAAAIALAALLAWGGSNLWAQSGQIGGPGAAPAPGDTCDTPPLLAESEKTSKADVSARSVPNLAATLLSRRSPQRSAQPLPRRCRLRPTPGPEGNSSCGGVRSSKSPLHGICSVRRPNMTSENPALAVLDQMFVMCGAHDLPPNRPLRRMSAARKVCQ